MVAPVGPGPAAGQKAFAGFPNRRGASQTGTVIVAVQYNEIDSRLHGENGRNVSQKSMFLL
jgi:hypothetical protein